MGGSGRGDDGRGGGGGGWAMGDSFTSSSTTGGRGVRVGVRRGPVRAVFTFDVVTDTTSSNSYETIGWRRVGGLTLIVTSSARNDK